MKRIYVLSILFFSTVHAMHMVALKDGGVYPQVAVEKALERLQMLQKCAQQKSNFLDVIALYELQKKAADQQYVMREDTLPVLYAYGLVDINGIMSDVTRAVALLAIKFNHDAFYVWIYSKIINDERIDSLHHR